MKVLLINTQIPKLFAGQSPNIGLGYLASSLIKESHSVKVLDFANNPDNIMGRLKTALNENPDIVGFYVTFVSAHLVVEIAKEIKKINNKIAIIAGGPHISIDGIDFMKENNIFDIGVVGEGERTIVDLCKVIEGQKKLEEVEGIIFRKNGNVIENPKKKFNEELDKLPFPEYSVFDTIGMDFFREYSIITSRGCPYNCIFCSAKQVSGNKWRSRDIKEVIKEIEYAKRKLNIKIINIYDDNFTMDMGRANEFCKLFRESEINLPWNVRNSRADKLDYELLKNMKESGCQLVRFGIESADPEVFKGIGKGETLEQIKKALCLAKKLGLRVEGSFVIGLPNSTYESEMKSLAFAKKNKLDFAGFYLLRICKGSKIWDIVEQTKKFKRYYISWVESFETDIFSKKQQIHAYMKCNVSMNNFLQLGLPQKGIIKKIKILGLILRYDILSIPARLLKFIK